MTLTDEQRKAGWIEHDGGPCPVPLESNPDVIYRDGEIELSVRAGLLGGDPNDGEDWWEWSGDGYSHDVDIIAYRPEPKP